MQILRRFAPLLTLLALTPRSRFPPWEWPQAILSTLITRCCRHTSGVYTTRRDYLPRFELQRSGLASFPSGLADICWSTFVDKEGFFDEGVKAWLGLPLGVLNFQFYGAPTDLPSASTEITTT